MEYLTSLEGVTAENLGGFFEGWATPPSPEQHLALLLGSDHVTLARHEGQVVGFVTAISDGVLAAYIPLLEVLPEYRHRGLGSGLVRRILDQIGPLYMIDVICDPEVQPFYERFGFQRATGAVIRNYQWASGPPI